MLRIWQVVVKIFEFVCVHDMTKTFYQMKCWNTCEVNLRATLEKKYMKLKFQ